MFKVLEILDLFFFCFVVVSLRQKRDLRPKYENANYELTTATILICIEKSAPFLLCVRILWEGDKNTKNLF